jgi:hypothetical protein
MASLRALGFAAVLLATPALGQVAMSPAPDAKLTSAQNARIRNIHAPGSAIWLVRLDPRILSDAQAGQKVKFAAGSSLAFTARSKGAQPTGAGRAVWTGDIVGGNGVAGNVTIAIDGVDATGTITTPDGKLYQLWPAGGGITAVIAVDRSKLPPDDPPQR